nr:HNH endonuclease [Sphingomonas sp. H160509]
MLLAHRVAWALHHGDWPSFEIDHEDGDKLNNAIDNLRPATRLQNSHNRPGRSRTGFKGVKRAASKVERYCATIMVAGCYIHLGTHDTPELAHEAYKRAARAHHGAFANFDIIRVGTIAATIRFGIAA